MRTLASGTRGALVVDSIGQSSRLMMNPYIHIQGAEQAPMLLAILSFKAE